MDKFGIRTRKRISTTLFLTFLMPGLGHLHIGQLGRGLLYTAILFVDYTSIYRLADSNGGQHLLLIVYLVMLLPIIYFMSILDVMQLFDHNVSDNQVSKTQGIGLLLAGLLIMVLIKPPSFFLPWVDRLAEWSVGPLVYLIAVIMANSYVRRKPSVYLLGRYTTILILVGIGSVLLWNQWKGHIAMTLLGRWWPSIFIMLGTEIIIIHSLRNKKPISFVLDKKGLAIAIMLGMTAFGVTQYAAFPVKWLNQFHIEVNHQVDYSEEKGLYQSKAVVKVPVDEQLSIIDVHNPNGHILIHSANVQELEIYANVWVDDQDKDEAMHVANQSKVHVAPGEQLRIEAKPYPYGTNGNRLPNMTMEIIIPLYVTKVEYTIKSEHGMIEMKDIYAEDGVTVLSNSGSVQLLNMQGTVEVQGNDSSVVASEIIGICSIANKNGPITIHNMQGESLYVGTQNGDIELTNIAADVDAETKNGQINIQHVEHAVKASTLNGNIEVFSESVNGNWDLDSSVGEIKMGLPVEGHYEVYGTVTFGEIHSELPLVIKRKSVRGTIGQGTYRIHINATNSIFLLRK